MNSLATVDDDFLWHGALFQHALFGVVPSASEQAWGLDTEVPNLLPMSVNGAPAILLYHLLILFLVGLKEGNAIVIGLHEKDASVQDYGNGKDKSIK